MTLPAAREEQNPFDRFPRLYDWEHDLFTDDVDVYVALARRFGGPVLELACGTGRVLAAVAAAGSTAPELTARRPCSLVPGSGWHGLVWTPTSSWSGSK